MLRVPVSGLRSGEQRLDAAESRYLVRVHRLRAGASFLAFDPEAGHEADAELLDADPRGARVRAGALRPARVVAPLGVELLQALGKGDKAEQVIRDATALGARRVVIVETSRSVPELGERASARLERWRKVAAQAARQSGRGDTPEICGPEKLEAALARVGADAARLVLSPDAETPLLRALDDWSAERPLALLVGPEGGLTASELELCESNGFRRVSFGPLVLRTETAATAVLGAILALAEARRVTSS